MDEGNIKLLMLAFIAILVGVVLINVTAEEGLKKTELLRINNETVDYTAARHSPDTEGALMENVSARIALANVYTGTNSWKAGESECDFVALRATNSTSTLGSTHYNISTDGYITFKNGTAYGGPAWNVGVNTSEVSYTYCGDDYLVASWQRTVLNLIPGFFGIALMIIAVGLFLVILKREGWIGI